MLLRSAALLAIIAGGTGPAFAQAPAAPPVPLPSVELPAPLERVLRDYERAWQGRDAAGLAALFAEDGFVLSNRSQPVRGREAIRRHYERAGGPLALRALAFATSDSVGYIVGAFATQTGGPDVGKFVLALRRRPGGPWLIAADIDNAIGR